ncbi:hypothetical protein GCM10027020_14110 [Nocardioides salsibiostraticola]
MLMGAFVLAGLSPTSAQAGPALANLGELPQVGLASVTDDPNVIDRDRVSSPGGNEWVVRIEAGKLRVNRLDQSDVVIATGLHVVPQPGDAQFAIRGVAAAGAGVVVAIKAVSASGQGRDRATLFRVLGNGPLAYKRNFRPSTYGSFPRLVSVVDQKMIIGSPSSNIGEADPGKIHRLALATGDLEISVDSDHVPDPSTPLGNDSFVSSDLIPSDCCFGQYLRRYSVNTLTPVWSRKFANGGGEFTVDGDRIYVVGQLEGNVTDQDADLTLSALDAAGVQVWTYAYPVKVGGAGTSTRLVMTDRGPVVVQSTREIGNGFVGLFGLTNNGAERFRHRFPLALVGDDSFVAARWEAAQGLQLTTIRRNQNASKVISTHTAFLADEATPIVAPFVFVSGVGTHQRDVLTGVQFAPGQTFMVSRGSAPPDAGQWSARMIGDGQGRLEITVTKSGRYAVAWRIENADGSLAQSGEIVVTVRGTTSEAVILESGPAKRSVRSPLVVTGIVRFGGGRTDDKAILQRQKSNGEWTNVGRFDLTHIGGDAFMATISKRQPAGRWDYRVALPSFPDPAKVVSNTVNHGFYKLWLVGAQRFGDQWLRIKNPSPIWAPIRGARLTVFGQPIATIDRGRQSIGPGKTVRIHMGAGRTDGDDIYLRVGGQQRLKVAKGTAGLEAREDGMWRTLNVFRWNTTN